MDIQVIAAAQQHIQSNSLIGTSEIFLVRSMKTIFVLLSVLCVLCSLAETLSNENIGQRNKELILKNKLKLKSNNFFGILLVPCMFVGVNVKK